MGPDWVPTVMESDKIQGKISGHGKSWTSHGK